MVHHEASTNSNSTQGSSLRVTGTSTPVASSENPRKLPCPFHFASADRAKRLTINQESPAHITKTFSASPANRRDRVGAVSQAERRGHRLRLPQAGHHLAICCGSLKEFSTPHVTARTARSGRRQAAVP